MQQIEAIFLHPGQIHVDSHPACVSSVCGPGVVVCLWDRHLRQGGIAHFVVSFQPTRHRPTAQFGPVALQRLLRMLRDLGSPPASLEAKIFGGASREDGRPELGEIAARNVEYLHEELGQLRIPLRREDVGGTRGRKIVYYTESNRVKVLRAENIRERDWHAPLDALRKVHW